MPLTCYPMTLGPPSFQKSLLIAFLLTALVTGTASDQFHGHATG